MLSPTADTLRTALHVLAATVWVGGQITLAGLVPTLRRTAPDAVRPIARAFARIAWPAYAVAVITGFWNLTAVDVAATSTAYQVTVLAKIAVAILAAVATAVHAAGTTKAAVALGGAIGGLASIAALVLGVLLGTGTG